MRDACCCPDCGNPLVHKLCGRDEDGGYKGVWVCSDATNCCFPYLEPHRIFLKYYSPPSKDNTLSIPLPLDGLAQSQELRRSWLENSERELDARPTTTREPNGTPPKATKNKTKPKPKSKVQSAEYLDFGPEIRQQCFGLRAAPQQVERWTGADTNDKKEIEPKETTTLGRMEKARTTKPRNAPRKAVKTVTRESVLSPETNTETSTKHTSSSDLTQLTRGQKAWVTRRANQARRLEEERRKSLEGTDEPDGEGTYLDHKKRTSVKQLSRDQKLWLTKTKKKLAEETKSARDAALTQKTTSHEKDKRQEKTQSVSERTENLSPTSSESPAPSYKLVPGEQTEGMPQFPEVKRQSALNEKVNKSNRKASAKGSRNVDDSVTMPVKRLKKAARNEQSHGIERSELVGLPEVKKQSALEEKAKSNKKPGAKRSRDVDAVTRPVKRQKKAERNEQSPEIERNELVGHLDDAPIDHSSSRNSNSLEKQNSARKSFDELVARKLSAIRTSRASVSQRESNGYYSQGGYFQDPFQPIAANSFLNQTQAVDALFQM